MPLMPTFIGGAYQSRFPDLANEALINLYLETTQSSGAPKRAALLGTPGLRSLLTVTDASCRGQFSQDGRVWAVIGTTLYEVFPASATATARGSVANDGHPVTFASNGRGGDQLAVCAGGFLYILATTTHTLTGPISLPFAQAVMVGFLDGYFLLLQQGTPTIWFSALEDGTSWDALDFVTRSHVSDTLVGFTIVGGRLWAFGSSTSEVFYDTGNADTPFAPYPGSVLPWGAVGPWAIAQHGLTIAWLAQNGQSTRTVMAVTFGAAPTAVSTPAIDLALNRAATLDDVEANAYQQEGHAFVLFTVPATGETWALDLGEKTWHQRQAWTDGAFTRWRARGLCAIDGQVLAGDYETGDLYTLALDAYDDNGAVLRRLRRAPYLSAENQWLFLDAVELGMEAGVGIGSGHGLDPQVMLRVSKDGGHTYGPVLMAPLGPQGTYGGRAIWRRIGRARSDRLLIEVSQTDPVQAAWGPGLWLTAQAGSGQL